VINVLHVHVIYVKNPQHPTAGCQIWAQNGTQSLGPIKYDNVSRTADSTSEGYFWFTGIRDFRLGPK